MSATLRSAITLIALTALLVGMAVWGFTQATAPFPSASGDEQEETTCENLRVKTRLWRNEVQVSVFNASSRSGLANDSLDRLRQLGFVAGNVGNAPDGTEVRRVEVWARSETDASARLVAASFRPAAPIVAKETLDGPGVNVVVGQRYRGPRQGAPRFVTLDEPIETCLD
ncbi:hypothetical protein GCM10027425_27010 [Alteromonas gracilis]